MVKKLPVAISKEEFTKLIEHTKKEKHKIAFLLGFGSGLRISEVCKLESRDIDIKEKSIHVRMGKGGRDRTVPLAKGFKEKHKELLPLNITDRALRKAFHTACKKAKLLENKPTLHFHSLRHGFATNAVNNGIPIHHVRTMMGHANVATTNVYLEMNPKDALKSYEDLF